MTKREVVALALEGKKPPYVPWNFGFTQEAREKLVAHYGTNDLEPVLGNHFLGLSGGNGPAFTPLANGRVRDYFGVIWDRSVDHDIGNVEGKVLPEPSLKGYRFPDPKTPGLFESIPGKIAKRPDLYRIFSIGFSLYERAWTLRGMEDLMLDTLENPEFVHELLDAITEWNLAQVREALKYDIDGVYFGDDWGAQKGLQMGLASWRTFIKPRLARMYGEVRRAGKKVFIHSCGDVDELFPDLVDIGLDCFNPFQPEVMDVFRLLPEWRGRLAFHGGLSTQRTLPRGSAQEVREETERLLDLGKEGGYIFAPAHAVEGDVPLSNMLAFIDTVQARAGGAAR